jgi:hypothetical protein
MLALSTTVGCHVQVVAAALDGFVLIASSDDGLTSTLMSNVCCFRQTTTGDLSNGALDECGSTSTPDVVVVVVVVCLRLWLRHLLPLPLPPLTLRYWYHSQMAGSSSGGGGGRGSSCSSRCRPRLTSVAVDFNGEEDDNCNPTMWGGADVVVVSWIGSRASASSPTKIALAPLLLERSGD